MALSTVALSAVALAGLPVAFMVLAAGAVFSRDPVGLSETLGAFWVVGEASSEWSVDSAEACVVFSLAGVVLCSMGITWACVVSSVADVVSPLCCAGVVGALAVPLAASLWLSRSVSVTGACVAVTVSLSYLVGVRDVVASSLVDVLSTLCSADVTGGLVVLLADVLRLACPVVVWTGLSEADGALWSSAPGVPGVASVDFTEEGGLFLSSESWGRVAGSCEAVLAGLLTFTGPTGVPEFLVTLLLLVVDLHTVVLRGAEVGRFPPDPFSVWVDLGSSAERPLRTIGSSLGLLTFFSKKGGFS